MLYLAVKTNVQNTFRVRMVCEDGSVVVVKCGLKDTIENVKTLIAADPANNFTEALVKKVSITACISI
jgi:hypothetical protein